MTPEERVMTASEAKTNMTNTGLEKRRPDNEEELPAVPYTVHQDSQKIGLR